MRRLGRFAGLAAVMLCAWLATASQNATGPGTSSQNEQKKAAALPVEAKVDINHDSIEELMKVPGMTATWAGRVVRFRPYRTKLDLLERGVVSSQVYGRIKDYVVAHRDKQ